MDKISEDQRRKIMQSVKSKNTKAEILLRKTLWRKGYRYRKNFKKLIGTPDIVFIKEKIAIFIDGGFWHGYEWDKIKGKIDHNKEYWIKKIEKNIERDKIVNEELLNNGWIVLRFWEKDVFGDIEKCVLKIEKEIQKRRIK